MASSPFLQFKRASLLPMLSCGVAATAAPSAPPSPSTSQQQPPEPRDASGSYSFAAVSTDGGASPYAATTAAAEAPPSWELPDVDGLLLVLAAFAAAVFVATRQRD